MILSFSSNFPTTITNTSGSTVCGIAPAGSIALGISNVAATKTFYDTYAETAFDNLLSGILTATNTNSVALSTSKAASEFLNHRSMMTTYSVDEKYNITTSNSGVSSTGTGSVNTQLETYPIVLSNAPAPTTIIQGNLYMGAVTNQNSNKINRISAYVFNGTGAGRFGVYTKSGTTFTLVAQSEDVTISTAGLVTGVFSSDVTLSPNTQYWLSFAFSSYYMQANALTDTGEISAPHQVAHIVTYLYGNPPTSYALPASITGGSSTTVRIWLCAWYNT